MSALRLKRQLFRHLKSHKCLSTAVQTKESSEYTTTPHYPEILDLSHKKRADRKKLAEYEAIKAVKTVEEKQIKLNMPRFYGFKCYMLREDYIPYNQMDFIQYITKTHLIKDEGLQSFYNEVDVSKYLNAVRSDLEEVILMELDKHRKLRDLKKDDLEKSEIENVLASTLVAQINRIVVNAMSRDYPHLDLAQTDLNPRIESFWYAGGMNPPEHVRRLKKGVEWREFEVDSPVNRAMNYLGSASLALRSSLPLKPILPMSQCENPEFSVPKFSLDPRTVGTSNEFRHIANVPGFWPGDPNEFGFLSFHNRGHLLTREYNDPNYKQDALDRQGILASFAWLNAQANFLGFNSFNDVTYPLITQTVITNGKMWSLYAYQLNTIQICLKHVEEKSVRNVCLGTKELKLYDEITDGKFVNFNDGVLQSLLKFYANAPEKRLGINLRPYLGREEKVSADYADDDKRQWLEREYKFLVANRPRYLPEYEIWSWEKIYKIDNKSKIMDKKRRPFELKINPWRRTLDDRQAVYIPRALRPHLPRSKGRYAKEYFP